MALLRRNVHQVLGVITAAFDPQLFDLSSPTPPCKDSDINALACEWRNISQGTSEMTDEEWISSVSQVAS